MSKELNHPCKETCSGWQQGHAAGLKARSPDALCSHDDPTWCDYKCFEATIKVLKARLAERTPDTSGLHPVLCEPCGQTVWKKAFAEKEPSR